MERFELQLIYPSSKESFTNCLDDAIIQNAKSSLLATESLKQLGAAIGDCIIKYALKRMESNRVWRRKMKRVNKLKVKKTHLTQLLPILH